MSMLHIVNKSPFERGTLNSCLKTSMEGCSVLLIEDGVVGAIKNSSYADQIASAMPAKQVYVLEPDLNARGFTKEDIIDGIKTVDYSGFVELTTENDNVQSWL
ncbi:MAG: sulfurtransferase complex subunit TusB [Pseudomonadota bacterium]